MYLVYNTTLLVHPEQYGTNYLYTTADVLGFVGACFYVFANLRDDNWFWFLPLAGQYGVAPGRVRVEPKVLPQSGKNAILITDLCRTRVHATKDHVVTVSYH